MIRRRGLVTVGTLILCAGSSCGTPATVKKPSSVDAPVLGSLITALNDPNPPVRRSAVSALGDAKDPRAVDSVIAALRDPDTEVRLSAIISLSKKFKDPRAVEPLIATLKDPDLTVRSWAVDALGEFKDPRAVDALIVAMNDPHSGVERMGAAYALTEINDRRGVDAVLALSNKGNPDVIVELRRALVAIGEPGTEDALIEALNKPGGAHVLLAQALLNSRNPKLEDAAHKWALKTGTPIVSVTTWSADTSGEWGSGR